MSKPDIKETDSLPECPLCGTDGVMEGKVINENTFIWVCDTCPAVLFEYSNQKNTQDLNEYLERDSRINYRHEREE